MGKFAEHNAKCPDGGAYLKSPMPLASAFPPDVSCPWKVLSAPKLKVLFRLTELPPLLFAQVKKYSCKDVIVG